MGEKITAPRKMRTHHSRQRSYLNPRRLLITAVVIWLGVMVAILARQVSDDFSRPLGAPLVQPGRPPQGLTSSEKPLSDVVENSQPPEVTSASQPVCGGPPQMIVLLVGSDTKTTDYIRGLADTIRVVRFDFVTPGLSVFAVPRALWVAVPSLAPYNDLLHTYFGDPLDPQNKALNQVGTYSMLNASYFYGNLYKLPGSGPGVLAEAIYLNLGIAIDHYAAVNEQIVVEMIDTIGGIDINVPYDIGGISAGMHHMTGEEVLSFARTRESDNDWYRVDRQNIALRAVWDELMLPSNFVKIPSLTNRFVGEAQTDLSKAQIASLVCLITRVNQKDVRYYSISPDMVTVSSTRQGFFILLPKEDKIAPVVKAFLSGG